MSHRCNWTALFAAGDGSFSMRCLRVFDHEGPCAFTGIDERYRTEEIRALATERDLELEALRRIEAAAWDVYVLEWGGALSREPQGIAWNNLKAALTGRKEPSGKAPSLSAPCRACDRVHSGSRCAGSKWPPVEKREEPSEDMKVANRMMTYSGIPGTKA